MPAPAAETPQRRRAPRWSMRARLTVWMVAVFSLIQWATGGIFWLYQNSSVERVFDTMLLSEARSIADALNRSNDLPDIEATKLQSIAGTELRTVKFGDFVVSVYDERGRYVVLGRSDPLGLTAADLAGTTLTTPGFRVFPASVLDHPDPDTRAARAVSVSTYDHMGRPYSVVVATGDAFIQNQLRLVVQILIIAAAVGPAAAAVSGWFIAGIAVAPFQRLSQVARGLGPDSMRHRIQIDSHNSEVSRLAAELDDARARIQRAFTAQERFLSNVSHEIKTPIAVLLTEAQTLDLESLPEDARAYVDSTREEMTRLGLLVESFLTLSRVQDGKGVVRGHPYAVNDLVMDSVDHCLLMAEQHLVRLVPTLIGGEDAMDVTVAGDPGLLCTMLENLIRNAIRFSPADARVTISASVDDHTATLCVADDGPGIPPDRIDRIFDRFEQADPERKGRGHGLGLAIAQGIAELHRGNIVARNRDGSGCTFEITLPIERPRPRPAAPPADAPAACDRRAAAG